jgi:hypothetical protein
VAAEGAVDVGEAAADEELAVGLLGEAHHVTGVASKADKVEGGVEGAVGIEAEHAGAGDAVVGGEHAADVEFVARDTEDGVDLGLAGGGGEARASGVEGCVERTAGEEAFEGGEFAAGFVAGDVAAGEDLAVGLKGYGVHGAGAVIEGRVACRGEPGADLADEGAVQRGIGGEGRSAKKRDQGSRCEGDLGKEAESGHNVGLSRK